MKDLQKKTWTKFTAGIIISIIFLYFAVRKVECSLVLEEIKKTSIPLIVLSIIVAYLNLFIRAFRWRYILIPIKKIPLHKITSYLLVGFTINNLFPLRVGEIGRSVFLGKKEGISKSSALASVIIERCFDLVGIAVYFPILIIAVTLTANTKMYMLIMVSIVLAGIILAYVMVVKREFSRRIFGVLTIILPERIRNRINDFLDSFLDGFLIIRRKRQIAFLLFSSVFIWFVTMIIVFIRFNAFHLPLSFQVAVLTVITVNIAGALPSSPGQIGVAHFAYVVALSLFDINKETALAFGLISHALGFLLTTIPGTIILFSSGSRILSRKTE